MEQQSSVDAATTDKEPLGLSEMRRRFVFSLLAGLLILIAYFQVKAALRDDAWFIGMALLGFGCFQLLKAGLWLLAIRGHARQKMGLSS